jgi:type IV fimbrial biogenesis protein FimT
MKRNTNAYVMPVTANDWSSGWNVFVDLDKNAAYNASTDYLVMSEARIPSRITTPVVTGVSRFSDGTNSYVLFNGSGFPRLSNGSFATSSSLEFFFDSTLRRRVIMNPAGRMRVCDPVVVSGCAE